MSQAFSGKSGKVKRNGVEIAEVTNWKFEPKTNVPKYASSSTAGFKKGVAAVRDSSGSFDIKIDAGGLLPMHDGDAVTLQLHLDGSGNNYFTVAAIISGMPVEVDINDGEIVGATYDFEGSGAWVADGIVESGTSSSGT